MNSFSIAYKNFRSNLKAYGLYLAAMIFSIVAYYNFLSLKYNPAGAKAMDTSGRVATVATATAMVLLIFLVFFIWFSSSFFLNQRKKEIGIYTFMGIEKYKIAAIFSVESIFLGLTSIVIGLVLGVLFGKLFIMTLSKVALLNVKIDFFISVRALLETAITFLIVFILTSIKGYIEISRSKLIDLFNALKKEEKIPKSNYLKGILSIIFIGAGYYISSISIKINFLTAVLSTILLIICGTYWFFSSFFAIVAKFITSRKSILYKGTNIISISNLVFRVRKNYSTLAVITLLIATTITAFGTASSIKYYINENYEITVPYTFSYVSNNSEVDEIVKGSINKSDHDLLLWKNIRYLNIDKFESNFPFYHKDFVIIKLSEFERVTNELKPKGYNKTLNKSNFKDGEALFVARPGTMLSFADKYENKNIEIGTLNFNVIEEIKTPILGGGVPKASLIVKDKDYDVLKEYFNEYNFNGIIVENEENSEALTIEIMKRLPENISLFSRAQAHKSSYDFYGVIYFLGSFMSLVFIVATGSIIYFKLLSDALEDKAKYQMLQKVGMTESEIIKSISKQVGVSFALPLIVGSIHSIAAINVLSKIMQYNLITPTIISISIFTLVYGIFYYGTTKKILNIVCESQ